MTPTPQEHQIPEAPSPPSMDGEKVVISGMAGLYPMSHHVKDLKDILYEKKNPVSADTCRWQYNHPEVSAITGNVPGLDLFDAQFFKVHYLLGNSMDAMGKKILEQSFQAIYDAGVSPDQLYGKKIGVYTGTCFSECEKACFYVAKNKSGFGIAGCSKTMFSNRISYWLNAKGPSMAIDEACCSSTAALEQGYQAILRGECEAAIVAGAYLCLHPQSSVHFSRIMKVSKDGKTKSFDENADGCAKSEAVNVLFLQKAKDAKRIYAEVLHVKTEYSQILESETGPRYGFYRDPDTMAGFLETFYSEAKVPPQAVEYVEACGSAVLEADKTELEAIEKVFCKDRKDKLLVGSVMSNIGYCEAASGISAITKVLLGYETGSLASNLHCENPRKDVAALREGRMEIVTDHKEFGRSYTAVNGMSVTGVNSHVLLKGHYKPKDLNRYKSAIPHLVTLSGRQDSAVENVIKDLKSRPVDPEELALFHNIHETRISGHMGRGYIILDTNEKNETVSLSETSAYFDDAKRPLWFVYSGMGSQWAGMGVQLMRIPVFAAAIEKCRQVLEPKGVDIVNIITSTDKTIFDNILHSFVGIAAVQIGLTDVLTSMGIVPDKIIGHSVGELGCAYADGCFTAEEMILSAYSRGLVSVQTPFIKGSMAAVGIGYQQVKEMLPPEIEVACHNAAESSTISGPADKMKEFVAELTTKGIFAKEVPCSNIAYHSKYIAEAGPGLLKYLSEVIKDPKPRSERWLSTSVPQDKWDEPAAKFSSAHYHTNNLLNPVLFEETSTLVPQNAVLIEIAPHGLLQAILKRSLPTSCKYIPMTRRGHPDNAFMVLDAVGKLYMEGFLPKVNALYPAVQFPVSTGTPMLGHLVEWAHHEKWVLPVYFTARRVTAAATNSVISLHNDDYLMGHVFRGKNVYPYSAALMAAWDTLSMMLGQPKKNMSVEFHDVHLYSQPPMHDRRHLRLRCEFHRGSGKFEVMDDNRKVATGYLLQVTKASNRILDQETPNVSELTLTSDDLYQMLQDRDYDYSGEFRSIHRANESLTVAEIKFNDNWATFLDGIFQLHILRNEQDCTIQVSQIRKLTIDIKDHVALKNKDLILAEINDTINLTVCGGIQIEDITFKKIPAVTNETIALKALKFVPRIQSNIKNSTALQVYLQIVAENISKDTLNVLVVLDTKEELAMFEGIKSIFDNIPGINVHYEQMRREKVIVMRDYFLSEVDLVLVQNLSSDDGLCQMLYRVLPRDIFIINSEEMSEERQRPSALYRTISSFSSNANKINLVKWRPTQVTAATTVLSVRNPSELSLLKATRDTLPVRQKLVVLTSYPPVAGLKELVRNWRAETERNQVYLISGNQHLEELPDLDLAFNVLNNGVWGGEYYTPCLDSISVDQAITLRSGAIGDLDSLQWVEAGEPAGDGIPVTVHYAALNTLDVKRAAGAVPFKCGDNPSETSYCMDFSGVTDSGQRVMGILPRGAASGRVLARPEFLWPVPDHWSLEDAATVPSAYCHVYYCLYKSHNLDFEENISALVHGGAGAFGQAAISVALALGYEVFTTVSCAQKKAFLMKLFPQLKEDHIGNSRDASFVDMIRTHTNGNGASIIFSTVQGSLKGATLTAVGSRGICLDTTQIANEEEFSFGMYQLTRERNYALVDFGTIFDHANLDNAKTLQRVLSEGISSGFIRPLTRVTFPPTEVSRAFRLLAASRHRGRVVLRLKDHMPAADPRLTCSKDLCQVVVCDEDSFGLHLVDRLVSRGARRLALQSGRQSAYLKIKVQTWEKLGVKVQLFSQSLSSSKDVVTLLTESSQIGPVEGVYVVATKATEDALDKWSNVVASLDLATRKLCPSLRYFAVVSSGVTIGQQICHSRVQDNLPATSLNIPALNKSSQGSTFFSRRTAVNAVERALRVSQTVVLAVPQKVAMESMVQQIAKLADIEMPEDISEHTTLADLNVEPVKVPYIHSYLQNVHSLYLAEEEILNLTVPKIKELQEVLVDEGFKTERGLGTFFSYVDPDELMATTEMVFMQTLSHSAAMRDDEVDVTQTHFCIIPGLEGQHERFATMCEGLKLPAIVFQPGLDHLRETIRETAERYAKVFLKKIEVKNNFYLLGYETGVLVALEVAAILEEHGLTGTVFCVGGTPEAIVATVQDQISECETEDDLQNAVVRHMFKLMAGNTEGVDKVLENISSWKEKIEACVRMLLGRVPHSAQYAKAWMEAAYERLKQIKMYNIQPQKLNSKLILLQATGLSCDTDFKTTTAMFQEYSKQPVVIYPLKAPLANAAYDLRCTGIVNKHLDDNIIEIFNKTNLCESYLVNASYFMTTSDDQ